MCYVRNISPLIAIFVVLSAACPGQAASVINLDRVAKTNIGTKDRISLQVVLGVLSALDSVSKEHSDFEYAQLNVRLGWILNDPKEHRFLPRGNLEALFELSSSIIYEGYGNYIGGVTALIRYNVVKGHRKCIPYVQAGVGAVYTDAYKEESQSAIGQAIEFTPQASLGLHCLIKTRWSIDAEIMFHHISNANFAERNRGINAIGGFLGVTYFSDWIWAR